MRKYYFLAGLPRSGSTLLSAILNQNPSIYSSATSGLMNIMGSVVNSWSQKHQEVQDRDSEEIYRLLKGVIDNKYEKIEKEIIFDKSRGWPAPEIISTMEKVLGHPVKIVATVRNVDSCAASFVKITNPENIDSFLRESQLIEHLKNSYSVLKRGWDSFPDRIHFVDYDDLVQRPRETLEKIHLFLDLPFYNYDFENIDGNLVKEKDEEVWGIKDLHKIRKKISKRKLDPKKILGNLHERFIQPQFWKGEFEISKGDLDRQLELSLMGKFGQSWKLAQKIEKKRPFCNRAAFNRGWFLMSQGKLLEGQKLLDRGRIEGVFGNPRPLTHRPIWDGISKGTVILSLEGGFGDQILHYRWVNSICQRGCRVIVACDPLLFDTFRQNDQIQALISHSAISETYHDFWAPSMSMITILENEYDDLSGISYIQRIPRSPEKKFKIGLRWEGNPEFEHEQFRKFPSHYLFNAVKNPDCEFISLQKDNGEDLCPSWVQKVNLSTWEDTRREISACDLVITSCTSVAHLSAAMGIPTWVIVPILPYYIWALPGNSSPWYDSVKLFRQTEYNSWVSTFKCLEKSLADEVRSYYQNSRPDEYSRASSSTEILLQ
jgi:hypothetical protein